MREQQNARQKKYYARLRQRKQSFQVIFALAVHIAILVFFRPIMKPKLRLQDCETIVDLY